MAQINVGERKNWVLLVLEAAQAKPLTPVQLQKSLFLLSEQKPVKKDFYKFRPYDYGPFSPEIYQDAEHLEIEGLATIGYEPSFKWKVYSINPEGIELTEEIKKRLPNDVVNEISKTVNHVQSLSFRDLVQEIYRDYPKYRVNSIFRD